MTRVSGAMACGVKGGDNSRSPQLERTHKKDLLFKKRGAPRAIFFSSGPDFLAIVLHVSEMTKEANVLPS